MIDRHPFIARDFGGDVCAVVSCLAGSRSDVHNISARWDIAPPQISPLWMPQRDNRIQTPCGCEAPELNGHREDCPVHNVPAQSEAVDHPAHYGGADNPYETIKVIESMDAEVLDGFCRGNALKYLMRAGKKDQLTQDLAKARWYLDYLVGYYERHG